MNLFLIFIVFLLLWFVIAIISKKQKTSEKKRELRNIQKNKTRNSNINSSIVDLNNFRFEKTKEQHKSSEIRISVDDIIRSSYDVNEDKRNQNQREDYRWILYKEIVTIRGREIKSGFFYTGKYMRSIKGYSIEPSFVSENIHREGDNNEIGYWPSFSGLTKNQQDTFLDWLSNGRTNTLTNIGYIFIFFYGLERRVLIDMYQNKYRDDIELSLIVAELKRLIYQYKDNYSFNNYAKGLLDFICVAFDKYEEVNDDFLKLENYKVSYDYYPTLFKIYLSKEVSKTNSLNVELALKWLYSDPFVDLRTPAIRCKEYFETLFRAEYDRLYPKGLSIKANKSKIKLEYRPASNSFAYENFKILTDLVDYTALNKPINILKEIATRVTDMLDQYSRYLGRNPDDTHSIKALSLLPKELLIDVNSDIVQTIKNKYLFELSNEDVIFASANQIIEDLKFTFSKSLKKKDVIAISQFLDKFNIGIEPDARFGSPQFSLDDKVLLFRKINDKIQAPSKEYSASLLIATLGLIISAADGTITQEEIQQITNHIKLNLDLNDVELRRLNYYLQWGNVANFTTSILNSKLKTISTNNKHTIVSFMMQLANADGYISPDEINILEKVYKAFGIDEKSLYSDIHNIQSSSYSTKSLESKTNITKGKSIALDKDIIKRTLEDTDEVQSLLTSIFDEDEVEEVVNTEVDRSCNKNIFNLDNKHSDLVRKLIEHIKLDENEFTILCEQYNLMPQGAIENINEVIYENLEDDLIYQEGSIEINQNIIEEIKNVCSSEN